LLILFSVLNVRSVAGTLLTQLEVLIAVCDIIFHPLPHGPIQPHISGTNVMKFGHALQDISSRNDSKGGFDDLELESGGQRLSADDYDFDPEDIDELNTTEEGLRLQRKSKWVKRVGAFLFMIGGVLNFVSFSYAAQSLLASLGSVQFVSNVVFGKVSQLTQLLLSSIRSSSLLPAP
jgi:hypothetical protein